MRRWIHRASGREVSTLGGFNLIYADPAWKYRNQGRGAASNHYHTMTQAQIKALPVADLAAKDCALAMWGTFPNTPEALETVKAWGFELKTIAFLWVKTNAKSDTAFWGGGIRGTRANAEPCWLAIRGNPERVSKGVHQLILDCNNPDMDVDNTFAARRPVDAEGKPIHSAKPQAARDRLVELCGDVPAIELFARTRDPHFEAWGNQVNQSIELRADRCPCGCSTFNDEFNCTHCGVAA